jgi:hypothetical protein
LAGLQGIGRAAAFKIKNPITVYKKKSWRFVMPAPNAKTRALTRLQLEAPVSDDASLQQLQEQVADTIREAERLHPSEPEALVCSVLDAVARDYFRHTVRKRLRVRRVVAVLLVLSATALIAAPAIARTDYDGRWNVTVVTRTGSCQPTTNYPLTVADGKVSGAADLSGSVGPGGAVRASLGGAFANGQLSGNTGSGRWNGASAGAPCSGRWTAVRQ